MVQPIGITLPHSVVLKVDCLLQLEAKSLINLTTKVENTKKQSKCEEKNRSQMREQDNSLEEELDEMEASNLSDRKFRVMIIRILNSMKKRHRNHRK